MKIIGCVVVAFLFACIICSAGEVSKNSKDVSVPGIVFQNKLEPLSPGSIKFKGYLGNKLDLCVSNRVMAQNVEHFLIPFKNKDDGEWGFRGEFWGKWYTSAMLGYGYTQLPEHRKIIDAAVDGLMATQGEDGYLGTSQAEAGKRAEGCWDIWGRKYAMLGLIANYDQTADLRVLAAAVRAADSLIADVGPESGRNIAATGWVGWKGLASCSVLEPIVLIYQRTGEKRFLDFAEYIVKSWDTPNRLSPSGLRLMQGVLGGTPMWKLGGAPKAYEMMSCFEGLCELYRATGNEYYLAVCKQLAENIIRDEITVIGSGSLAEIWCSTKKRQTEPMYHAMETCVTATWLKYLYQLLRLTGDSKYADEMEITLYNALIASMMPKGEWWSYFTPLMGVRTPSHLQFADLCSSCCSANGPRALMLTPYWAVMSAHDGIAFNLYALESGKVQSPSGQSIDFECITEYPRDGKIKIILRQDKPEKYLLKLRIPEWSKNNVIRLNEKNYDGYVISGTYANIQKEWKSGDIIDLELDMRTRVEYAPSGTGDQALIRGPIVLAFDSRMIPPQPSPQSIPMYRYEFHHNQDGDFVDAELRPSSDPSIWMSFLVTVHDEAGNLHKLPMCDYTSAGNLWTDGNVFRTWIQQPFDVRHLYVILDWRVNTHVGATPQVPEIYKK